MASGTAILAAIPTTNTSTAGKIAIMPRCGINANRQVATGADTTVGMIPAITWFLCNAFFFLGVVAFNILRIFCKADNKLISSQIL